jgi:uncharacterized glyoxalase superfamily metalloenzyme YdcJ
MTVMIAEMYDALIEAGASEEKARRAASVLADYDSQFADIKSELRMLKWAQAATFAMSIAIFAKLFIH